MRKDLIYCATRSLIGELSKGYSTSSWGDKSTLIAGDKVFNMIFLIFSIPLETILLPISFTVSLFLKPIEVNEK